MYKQQAEGGAQEPGGDGAEPGASGPEEGARDEGPKDDGDDVIDAEFTEK